ncbi:TPA: LysR family transcriptional regulator [Legionella pneumophila subsp. pneumophila]|uniref:HTH lysR-type domain-containing protein n=1 Tax=Legionella pneumophila (strain Lens) TaxID=297245 RepID=Q5WZP9_LEGPL|nr:LysR family transcriptional regulator [Legionella pneumophila]AOW52989.1 LysR family transcriptional regulator [Legionella pneumophila subsp. pneumophila]AOW56109.1 LysR family transcriptional regulator [Legionella pneumophila subsp. pneumophila]AOW63789.1 LysR family transcriptional regulator [Legionella pneumophila subsp. pneumophila]RYW85566.1 LysR family transcriptional regulator [Legionella pneumophila]RYW85632.1 LysR family transcriptional regulator [Legionella pneumophila]
MDIRDIKSFLAVIEYHSLTLAAKKLHVTQSAMSKRIRKIEDELNVRLIISEGSKLIFTEAAKQLIPYARQMFSAHQNMVHTLKNSQQFTQSIIIGASVYVSHYILPSFFKYLKEINPAIQAHLKTISEKEVEYILNHSTVDLVICPAREVSEKLLGDSLLWEEKLNLVVAANHELAHRTSELLLSELSEYPAILTEKGAALRDKIDNLFEKNQLVLNLGFEMSTIDAIKSIVEYGLGWSYLPDSLLSEKLKILTIKDLELTIPFHAYYLKKRINDRLINDLLSNFKKWINRDDKQE